MDAGFAEVITPFGEVCLGTGPARAAEFIPYRELLEMRPWESELARIRLDVPKRLVPPHCPVITNWVAITGATCAGKSTTIEALAARGYKVVREVARAYTEGELDKGRDIEDVRRDDHTYRRTVFDLTREAEKSLFPRAHELIFFDRTAIDCLSFHRASGYDAHEILRGLESYRFGHVFHLNALPFENDRIRTHCEDRRLFLDAALERDYRALQYRATRVPRLSVENRVDFILSALGETGH